jgi:hypothetical protein
MTIHLHPMLKKGKKQKDNFHAQTGNLLIISKKEIISNSLLKKCSNICFLSLSIIMGLVYALFAFGVMGSTNKICAANNIEFNPYPYQNQSDLD